MFEQATEALESSLNGAESQQQEIGQSNSVNPIDLDTAEKIIWKGKEYTPDQLNKQFMLQSDYTKKAQALSESRKYYEALDTDLDAIRRNPGLKDEFLKVYPKEFHKFLRYAINESSSSQQSDDKNSNLPPEVQAALDRLNRIEGYVQEKEVQAAEQQIENITSKMMQKYPEAVEEVVLAKAQALIENNIELTQERWDKLFKTSHESMLNRFKEKNNKTFNAQKTANAQARGIGSGGGTPSQAPRKMSFAEATEQAIRDLKG